MIQAFADRTSHHLEPAAALPATIAVVMHCMHMRRSLVRVHVGLADAVGSGSWAAQIAEHVARPAQRGGGDRAQVERPRRRHRPLYGDSLGPEDSIGATFLSMEKANANAMVRGFTGGEHGS